MSEDSVDQEILLQNRLLALLPSEELARLAPAFHLVHMDVWATLYEPGTRVVDVYFPVDGVISMTSTFEDGGMVEIGTIGREGMAGLFGLFGDEPVTHLTSCQVPGRMLHIPAALIRFESERSPALGALLRRFSQALFTQVAQTAACNRLHSLPQRCARWLLMTCDRVGSDEFLLTQAVLATMLGVRRAGVSTAARDLQNAGLIRYSRGRVTVLDRKGLHAAACPCYDVVRLEYDRLLRLPLV